MQEKRLCIYCEDKWCLDHECQNPYLILFNPYDRDDGSEEDLEEAEIFYHELGYDNESSISDQRLEEKLEKHVGVASIFKGQKVYDDNVEEQEEKVEEEEIVLTNAECCVDQEGEVDSGNILVEIPVVEGFKVCDGKPERELEPEFISLKKILRPDSMVQLVLDGFKVFDEKPGRDQEQVGQFPAIDVLPLFAGKLERDQEKSSNSSRESFDAGGTEQFKQVEVFPHLYISVFDFVKHGVKVDHFGYDFSGIEHKIVKDVLGLYSRYKGNCVPYYVFKYKRPWKYKNRSGNTISKEIVGCINKAHYATRRFQFDPGIDLNFGCENIDFATNISYFKGFVIIHSKVDCAASIARSLESYLVALLELIPFLKDQKSRRLAHGSKEYMGVFSFNAWARILLALLALVLCRGVRIFITKLTYDYHEGHNCYRGHIRRCFSVANSAREPKEASTIAAIIATESAVTHRKSLSGVMTRHCTTKLFSLNSNGFCELQHRHQLHCQGA